MCVNDRWSAAVRARVKCLLAAVLTVTGCLSSACGHEHDGSLRIHDVQGAQSTSPYEGERVSLEGVAVTAVGDRGFFVQEPAQRIDDDPDTSEGLYVYGEVPATLEPGHRVAIDGRVIEFHGHTQLKASGPVRIRGRGEVPAASPLDDVAGGDLESLESMRVSVEDGWVASPSDQHGEVRFATGDGRPVRLAESPGIEYLPEMDPAGLGGRARGLASPRSFSATGVLVYRYGDYVLWPSRLELAEAPDMPRPVRAAEPGELAVASYNLRLLFDETREADEPVVDADTFRTRLSKHAGWLERVLGCPAVVAVQEVEAPGVLSRLAGETECDYQAFAQKGHGDLALGFLLGPGVELIGEARPMGAGEHLPGTGQPLFDRPPLKAVIRMPDGPLALINVHLRSMRGLGDEPRVIVKRRAQADALHQLVEETRRGVERVLVLGDFNALPFDDGFVDVLRRAAGGEEPDRLVPAWKRLPPGERYSYLYRGHGQMLDHALMTPSVADRVTEAAFARGNADAPVSLANDADTVMRASDHDPFVIYLRELR